MTRYHKHRLAITLIGTLLAVMTFNGSLFAQNSPDWTEPFPPFRITGNLYYVGSRGRATYLITTP